MKHKNSANKMSQILLSFSIFIILSLKISMAMEPKKNSENKWDNKPNENGAAEVNTWRGEQLAIVLKYPKCWEMNDHLMAAHDAFVLMPTEKCDDKRKWKIIYNYPEMGSSDNPKLKKKPKTIIETINGEKVEFDQYIYSGNDSVGDRSWTATILCQGKSLHPSYIDYPSVGAKFAQRKENEVPPIFLDFIKGLKCL